MTQRLDRFKDLINGYIPSQLENMVITHPTSYRYRIQMPKNKNFHLEQTLEMLEYQGFKLLYFDVRNESILLEFVSKK